MTTGSYRVLESTRETDELLLLETTDADPVYVSTVGYEQPLASTVESIDPGNLLAASFDWSQSRPRFETITIESTTTFTFVSGATNLFEAAINCWENARASGEPMNSMVTYDTDRNPNGVVYAFAEQSGEQSLFEEFRDGIKPLDPLLEPIERVKPPYALFCLDPIEYPCVIVTIAFDQSGLFAKTVRDTYVE
ncbi:DUF6663 family protein [Halocatena halophila]|uniref:DUF6663 family protein n=1 Tax=Halocatena halophila TaxID=2814576 RepID=UPI002ECFD81F